MSYSYTIAIYYSYIIIEDAHGALHRRPLTFLGLLVEECITKYVASVCIICFFNVASCCIILQYLDQKMDPKSSSIFVHYFIVFCNVTIPDWAKIEWLAIQMVYILFFFFIGGRVQGISRLAVLSPLFLCLHIIGCSVQGVCRLACLHRYILCLIVCVFRCKYLEIYNVMDRVRELSYLALLFAIISKHA